MSAFDAGRENGHDTSTDLSSRAARSLSECMTVLPEGGDVYTVVGENGATYSLDAREGRCTCPDAQYNLDDDELCKHAARVAYATGERSVPAWVDVAAVDAHLGEHVDGGPQLPVAADGAGADADENGDGADPEDEPEPEGHDGDLAPDACDCDGLPDGMPCFECYQEGAEFDR